MGKKASRVRKRADGVDRDSWIQRLEQASFELWQDDSIDPAKRARALSGLATAVSRFINQAEREEQLRQLEARLDEQEARDKRQGGKRHHADSRPEVIRLSEKDSEPRSINCCRVSLSGMRTICGWGRSVCH